MTVVRDSKWIIVESGYFCKRIRLDARGDISELKRIPLSSYITLGEDVRGRFLARKRPLVRVEMAGVEPASRKFGYRRSTSLFGLLFLARDHLDRQS